MHTGESIFCSFTIFGCLEITLEHMTLIKLDAACGTENNGLLHSKSILKRHLESVSAGAC